MKKFKLSFLTMLVAAFVTMAFIGCQKEATQDLMPGLTSNAVGGSCCVTAYTATTLFHQGGLKVTAQNDESNITVSISRSEGSFTKVDYKIYKNNTTAPAVISNNPGSRNSFTITSPLPND